MNVKNMALPESENQEKKNDSHKGFDKKEKLPTKVIIRRLPPNMDQKTFLDQISPVPSYDYFYMVKGDASLGDNAFARAYINFNNSNDVYDFKEKFDNYVFLDNAGHEFPAVVEFAAFQKIPKRRNKVRVDPKVASIESDPYYLEFVEIINKPPEQDEKPEYSYQITDTKNEGNESTPLLEYVKNKRVEKMRIREERREERKRKEFERKKYKEDERRKRFEDKSPIKEGKTYQKTTPKEKNTEKELDDGDTNKKIDEKTTEKEAPEKYEKPSSSSYYKGKEKKFDDRKKEVKGKYTPKKEFYDKKEYKSRRDDHKDYKERDYRTKHDDYKKDDPKAFPKKVKKYSEKREERKIEAQKAEQKKLELQQKESKTEEKVEVSEDNDQPIKHETKSSLPKDIDSCKEFIPKNVEKEGGCKDIDSQSQKRIRNKDRPTIAIYRPGMLSKRKQNDGEPEVKECSKKE